MKKVYIDISALSDLKSKKDMLDLINKSKSDSFTYYYSPAHLDDLDSAGAKENKPELREEELKYIENIVGNNHIYYNRIKNKLLVRDISLTHYIDECFKSGTVSNKHNDIMKSDSAIYEINEVFNGKLDYEESEVRKWLYAMTDDNAYKENKRELMANYIISEEKLKSYIKYLFNKFPNNLDLIIYSTYDCIDFLEGIENKLKSILLENGLKPKIKLVDRPKNSNADALHCFCATYCDYFITLDKTLFSKSIFVYDFLNSLGIIEEIKTKVYTLDKFIEEVKNNLN
ncbi:hypothetical protein [uncultured Brachyspira sp.]|uniref:hypothetical protein n=1 Tax=uncultured Brachyspira sp. TaxID=221953 RepID=UPI002591C842|nr:hypothetical protein [uncultured Brachyspira sp.]